MYICTSLFSLSPALSLSLALSLVSFSLFLSICLSVSHPLCSLYVSLYRPRLPRTMSTPIKHVALQLRGLVAKSTRAKRASGSERA